MRKKISNHWTDHNIRRTQRALILLIGLVLIFAGCGQSDGPDTKSGQKPAAADGRNCPVTVNTQPWQTFKSLSGRMSAGQVVPTAELEAYANLPAVTTWRLSLAPNTPSPFNMVNWLVGAWQNEMGLEVKRKTTSDRFSIIRTFRYSQSHSTEIDSLLEDFTNGTAGCRIWNLANLWLSPENIPSPLVLHFLPAKAEIRLYEDEVLFDTGVLQAGGTEQSVRHIVTLLYRKYEALSGPNPVEVDGEEAIANALRVMMTEGTASWIGKTLELEFDRHHPDLGKVHIVPEDYFRKSQQTVELMEKLLPPMLDDPALMARDGREFARSMAASNAYNMMGLAMTSVIANRLGTERLHQVNRSVPDFVAAYQEAAQLNPSPAPKPGKLGVKLYETVPPLSPELYQALHGMLSRHYADQ